MNYNTRAGNNLFDVRESLLDVLLLKVANFEQAISKRNDARGKLATLLLRVANFMSVVYYVIEPYKSWQPLVESCKVDNLCEGLVDDLSPFMQYFSGTKF